MNKANFERKKPCFLCKARDFSVHVLGKTKRPLRVRIEEREKVRLGETGKSKIAQHDWEEEHRMQWDQASIIAKEDR